MKLIGQIISLFLLINLNACSQELNSEVLLGEWSLSPDYDEADVIIFRSDNTYLVYSELDYQGFEPEKYDYNVFFDNGIDRTAIVETGKWKYEANEQKLILFSRVFLKEKSDFNNQNGVKSRVIFLIGSVTTNELKLCSLDDKNSCDTYVKNANFTGNETKFYYREIAEDYSSRGQQTKTLDLSGYERDLKVSYEFFKEPDELIIEDRKGKVLFSTEMISTSESQTAEIDLRGVTQLVFKVNCSKPESKWKYSIDIK
jgi:hypothetical protein